MGGQGFLGQSAVTSSRMVCSSVKDADRAQRVRTGAEPGARDKTTGQQMLVINGKSCAVATPSLVKDAASKKKVKPNLGPAGNIAPRTNVLWWYIFR